MKASELIHKLQKAIDTHGDLEVEVYDGRMDSSLEVTTLWTPDTEFVHEDATDIFQIPIH